MDFLKILFTGTIFIVFLGLIVSIRYIKIKIDEMIKLGNFNNTIEEYSLLSSFKTKSYSDEMVLLTFGVISYIFSNFYYELYLVNIVLLLTFLYSSLVTIQGLFFRRLYEQPYFEEEKLYETSNDSVFNKSLEDKLKKVKLLGKENSMTKKVVIFEFLKTKIENNVLRKMILFIYFYFVSISQMLLLIFGIIYWVLKIKGKI
jgi:hypothetical protein